MNGGADSLKAAWNVAKKMSKKSKIKRLSDKNEWVWAEESDASKNSCKRKWIIDKNITKIVKLRGDRENKIQP